MLLTCPQQVVRVGLENDTTNGHTGSTDMHTQAGTGSILHNPVTLTFDL